MLLLPTRYTARTAFAAGLFAACVLLTLSARPTPARRASNLPAADFSSVASAHTQSARQTRRRVAPRGNTQRQTRRAPRVIRVSRDYRTFVHTSPTHRGVSCASCHKIDSVRRIDVVDFPDHDSCLDCHRQQFFNGARPNICTICHTNVSPRDGSRFKFPAHAAPTEFANIFPHDKHQFVIAGVAPAHRSYDSARFVRASFAAQEPAPPAKPVESCATCHLTDTTARPAPAEWIEDKELSVPGKIEPVPVAGTFKTSPAGHGSCFQCHWQSQQPVATDCAGCHGVTPAGTRVVKASVRSDANASRPAPRIVAAHSKDLWRGRISAKFRHDREDHKGFSCSSCHTNILEATSLDRLAPEVPLATCAGCHAGTRKDIQKEMDKVKADAGYSCSYCHQSQVGSRDIPASHYSIVGRTPGPARAEASRPKTD